MRLYIEMPIFSKNILPKYSSTLNRAAPGTILLNGIPYSTHYLQNYRARTSHYVNLISVEARHRVNHEKSTVFIHFYMKYKDFSIILCFRHNWHSKNIFPKYSPTLNTAACGSIWVRLYTENYGTLLGRFFVECMQEFLAKKKQSSFQSFARNNENVTLDTIQSSQSFSQWLRKSQRLLFAKLSGREHSLAIFHAFLSFA